MDVVEAGSLLVVVCCESVWRGGLVDSVESERVSQLPPFRRPLDKDFGEHAPNENQGQIIEVKTIVLKVIISYG